MKQTNIDWDLINELKEELKKNGYNPESIDKIDIKEFTYINSDNIF